ncbi:MAG: ribonuclease H-like domain-containing protein [Armatimonadetes bacterium]|nr:ribonuclease H-like domain-containing protein [Armatimonadota bacterium]
MAKSDDLMSRLEAMNRGPLRNRPQPESELAEVRRKLQKQRRDARKPAEGEVRFRRDLPYSAPKPEPRRAPTGPPVDLAQAVPGVEVTSPCGGRAFLIERPVSASDATAARVGEALHAELALGDSALRQRLCAATGARRLAAEDLVFVDIETAGLSSAPLFLIGTMVWDGAGLVVRQYFARDYSEESAVTSLFLDGAAGTRMLVSFNGKSFDLPFIRTRAAANALPYDLSPPHFDLLHESRRIWRDVLPDCRLQTLEQAICGRTRTSDIPGSEIPEAYHHYVRTGNAAQMVEVIEHNLLDLVTLADLMVRLPLSAE